jgi:hypothetical protein
MAIYFILTLTVSHPDLRGLPQVPQADTTYLKEVWQNFCYVIKYLGDWYADHGLLAWPKSWRHWAKEHWMVILSVNMLGLGIGLLTLRIKKRALTKTFLEIIAVVLLLPFLITIGAFIILTMIMIRGFWEQPSETIHQNRTILVVLSISLFLTCFYVLFNYPAELLKRLFIIWAIVAGSVFGRGLLVAMVTPGWGTFPFLSQRLSVNLPQILTKPGSWRILLIAFLTIGYGPRLIWNYGEYQKTRNEMIARQDFALDPAQPRLLQEEAQSKDIILYENLVVLPFFLSYGALRYGAVYLPLLPLPAGFELKGDKVKWMAGWNPYLKLLAERSIADLKYPLPLSPGAALHLQLTPEYQVESLEILSTPGNLGPPGRRLSLEHRSDRETLSQNLEIHLGKWQTHYLSKAWPGGELILRNQGNDPVYLAGLRLQPGNDQGLNWPWKGVVRVSWQTPGSAPQTFCQPQEYALAGRRYRIQVLQDGGASVLWKLIPKSETQIPP